MDDRARFKLAGRAVIAAGVLWIILAVGAVLVVLLVIRAVVHRNNLEVLIPVFAAAAIYGVWFLSTSLLARLLTNESKGYRPWRWGMIARTEAGKSAEQFDIPLTYSESKDALCENIRRTTMSDDEVSKGQSEPPN